VHLETSTKPHVHWKIENFGTNIASTMACPNFKNGPKTGLRPLGVKGTLGNIEELFFLLSIWYIRPYFILFLKFIKTLILMKTQVCLEFAKTFCF
jgi:hypothetical protein